MEEMAAQKRAAAELKQSLEEFARNGRFSVPDRVNHIRTLQKVDGVEIYAVQYTTIQRAAQTAELVAGSGMGWRAMLWVCGGRRSADGRQSPGPPALRIHPLMMHLHRLMGRARTHARALSDARQNRDRYMCRTPAQFGARKRSWAV